MGRRAKTDLNPAKAIYHDGPATVWLSKAPGDVSDYDGSGPWAKIHEIGATFSPGKITFPASGMSSIAFTIPACTRKFPTRQTALGGVWPRTAG